MLILSWHQILTEIVWDYIGCPELCRGQNAQEYSQSSKLFVTFFYFKPKLRKWLFNSVNGLPKRCSREQCSEGNSGLSLKKRNVFQRQISLGTSELTSLAGFFVVEFFRNFDILCFEVLKNQNRTIWSVSYFIRDIFFWGSPMNNLWILWHVVWKGWATFTWWKCDNERTARQLLWLVPCVLVWGRFGYQSCL